MLGAIFHDQMFQNTDDGLFGRERSFGLRSGLYVAADRKGIFCYICHVDEPGQYSNKMLT
jgi:hypothetical protein